MLLSLISLISPIASLLVIVCIFIKNWNSIDHKNLKKYIFPLGIIFGVFGYSMSHGITTEKDDLLRYYDIIQNFGNVEFGQIIKDDIDMLYTRDLLFYIVNKTGKMNILPFIVGIITYSIVFYVLMDMIKNSKRKFKTSEIVMLGITSVGMVSAYSIIGNVRCVLSYVLISFAVYRELVQKKKNLITLFLYIVPLGLHTSAIIIIIIRILSLLLKYLKKWAIIISLCLPQIINFAHTYLRNIGLGSVGRLITNTIDKAYYYLYWNEGGWATAIQNSISNKVTKISGSIFLILIIITINVIRNKQDEKEKKLIDMPMINYLYFVSLFAFGCLTIKTGAFWRFYSVVALFSPVVLIQAYNIDEKFKKIFTIFVNYGLLMFIVNNIYQIRNLDFMMTSINFIKASGLRILIELIRGFLKI